MTTITIVRSDNCVVVDGRPLHVDCSSLDPHISVVQWNENGDGTGHIEFAQPGQSAAWLNGALKSVDDLRDFRDIIDTWYAAANLIDHPAPLALEQAKARKKILIREDAVAASMQTFSSDALGAVHEYPTDELSQKNLLAGVLTSLLPNGPDWTTPFWCADNNGAWSFAEHTVTQIQAVGVAGKKFVVDIQRKHADLNVQIDVATTVEAVDAIRW